MTSPYAAGRSVPTEEPLATPQVSDESVPPTQYLAMEVLAARWRLGESLWTFPSSCRAALRSLAARGWVRHKGGIVEHTERAWLTSAGIAAWGLDRHYAPPSRGPAQDAGAPSATRDEAGQSHPTPGENP